MNKTYSYPINSDWDTQEIIIVIDFLTGIEDAYEIGIMSDVLFKRYQRFKKIVTSISAEKRLDRQFQQHTGYSIYQVMKKIKKSNKDEPFYLKMKGN